MSSARSFELPIIWFLLPLVPAASGSCCLHPATAERCAAPTRQTNELYKWLLGSPDMLPALYDRLRAYGIADPDAADEAAEHVTGIPSPARRWSYDAPQALSLQHRPHVDQTAGVVQEDAGFGRLSRLMCAGKVGAPTSL